ncbi:MAG: BlaI/MecI/CopY family transcriptional regulator [Verrucomicrobiota bacterium]|nr:BlaI/MecI/CopY family transcriptional regulator [Verrucomicrobiota bacterium]
MPRKSSPLPRPTDAELAILRVLWQRGPSIVREVLDAVNERRSRPLAYTTILRFLQIMMAKGLVVRAKKERAHLYQASVPPGQTKRHLVRDLMERLFDGSARDLVLEALGARKVSARELREIRQLLDQLQPPQ